MADLRKKGLFEELYEAANVYGKLISNTLSNGIFNNNGSKTAMQNLAKDIVTVQNTPLLLQDKNTNPEEIKRVEAAQQAVIEKKQKEEQSRVSSFFQSFFNFLNFLNITKNGTDFSQVSPQNRPALFGQIETRFQEQQAEEITSKLSIDERLEKLIKDFQSKTEEYNKLVETYNKFLYGDETISDRIQELKNTEIENGKKFANEACDLLIQDHADLLDRKDLAFILGAPEIGAAGLRTVSKDHVKSLEAVLREEFPQKNSHIKDPDQYDYYIKRLAITFAAHGYEKKDLASLVVGQQDLKIIKDAPHNAARNTARAILSPNANLEKLYDSHYKENEKIQAQIKKLQDQNAQKMNDMRTNAAPEIHAAEKNIQEAMNKFHIALQQAKMENKNNPELLKKLDKISSDFTKMTQQYKKLQSVDLPKATVAAKEAVSQQTVKPAAAQVETKPAAQVEVKKEEQKQVIRPKMR